MRHIPGPHAHHPGWWGAFTARTDGPKLAKHFNIKTHGEESAKALAIAERQRQLEQVRDRAHRR